MPSKSDIARFVANFQSETDGAALYRAMAEGETKAELAELYRRLATVEETHAEFWRRRIERAGGTVPAGGPGWRTRLLVGHHGQYRLRAKAPAGPISRRAIGRSMTTSAKRRERPCRRRSARTPACCR